ncbi:MAG: hypothetical protein LBG77_08710 [Dysgonamonadaceae bacterium]|jgi:hypothetical protein|nr:hypothetical protein [Dysgonamonadaceae bacterium]
MKKLKTTVLLIAVLFAANASAQTLMQVYKNGGAFSAMNIPVAEIDSVKFVDAADLIRTITSADLDSEGYYTIEEPVVDTHTYIINTTLVTFSHLWGGIPVKGMKFHIPSSVSKISFSTNSVGLFTYAYIQKVSNPGGWDDNLWNGGISETSNSFTYEESNLSSLTESWLWIATGEVGSVVGQDIELTIVLE